MELLERSHKEIVEQVVMIEVVVVVVVVVIFGFFFGLFLAFLRILMVEKFVQSDGLTGTVTYRVTAIGFVDFLLHN